MVFRQYLEAIRRAGKVTVASPASCQQQLRSLMLRVELNRFSEFPFGVPQLVLVIFGQS